MGLGSRSGFVVSMLWYRLKGVTNIVVSALVGFMPNVSGELRKPSAPNSLFTLTNGMIDESAKGWGVLVGCEQANQEVKK